MTDVQTDPTKELDALKQIAEALADLDGEAVQRVLTWAADRFGAKLSVSRSGGDEKPIDGNGDSDEQGLGTKYDDVASLFHAASPSTESDRALVIGYWVQYQEGAEEFEAFTINKQLKNLGHGVGNITDALDRLKARKPQLVIQTKKSGTSRQARKKYKLTNAGRLAVEAMLRGE